MVPDPSLARDPSLVPDPSRASAARETSPAAVAPARPAVPAPACDVPHFSPLHVRGGSARLRRALRRRRRTLAAGLAVAAATLALGAREAPGPAPRPAAVEASAASAARPVALVSAPVRIADAAAVRLLEPGDRVDVVAAGGNGQRARVVASDARVAQVPETEQEGLDAGALVVLEVTRPVSTTLVGAGADTPLAVTLR